MNLYLNPEERTALANALRGTLTPPEKQSVDQADEFSRLLKVYERIIKLS